MRHVSFTIAMPPVAKARPRMTRGGHVYTPTKTTNAERAIRAAYMSEVGHAAVPRGGGVKVRICCEYRIPASWPKHRQQAALMRRIHHTSRPDVDNLAKTVLDALNGVAFNDDRQVCDVRVVKRWAETDAIRVRLTFLDDYEVSA